MAMFNFDYRKTPEQRLLETPLPPSLAYAYGKLTHPPGEGLPMPPSITPPGTMGPPGGMDLPYEKPPSTIGELVALLGPMKTIEELSSPKYMKLGESILATGRGGKREIITPPPQPKYSIETDVEGGRREVRYGLPDEPPLTRSVGGFPLKPPETTETWEPPYAGPGGSLLQKSSRGKVGSVLGRLGEGGSAADTQEFREVKEATDFIQKFIGGFDPMKAMILSLNPKLAADPTFQASIKGSVPSHLKPLYNKMLRKIEKYYGVPEQPEQPVGETLPEGLSESDIEYNMETYGKTRDEVINKYKQIKGLK